MIIVHIRPKAKRLTLPSSLAVILHPATLVKTLYTPSQTLFCDIMDAFISLAAPVPSVPSQEPASSSTLEIPEAFTLASNAQKTAQKTAQSEAEVFVQRQKAALAAEVKAVLDSWRVVETIKDIDKDI
ncbi:hypothetical protein V8D89_004928 [Ganoderma adspersum]